MRVGLTTIERSPLINRINRLCLAAPSFPSCPYLVYPEVDALNHPQLRLDRPHQLVQAVLTRQEEVTAFEQEPLSALH